jgi:hypothetical protein
MVVPVALLSPGAAAIHLAAAASHSQEWWAFRVFFSGSGVAQLVWAVLTVTSPSRLLSRVGAPVNAAIVALWIATRAAGNPIGPDAGTGAATEIIPPIH